MVLSVAEPELALANQALGTALAGRQGAAALRLAMLQIGLVSASQLGSLSFAEAEALKAALPQPTPSETRTTMPTQEIGRAYHQQRVAERLAATAALPQV